MDNLCLSLPSVFKICSNWSFVGALLLGAIGLLPVDAAFAQDEEVALPGALVARGAAFLDAEEAPVLGSDVMDALVADPILAVTPLGTTAGGVTFFTGVVLAAEGALNPGGALEMPAFFVADPGGGGGGGGGAVPNPGGGFCIPGTDATAAADATACFSTVGFVLACA